MKPCTIFLILLQTLATARPNVLLIITDDQNDYATSASGINPLSPPCMTPNPGFHDPYAKSKSLTTIPSNSRFSSSDFNPSNS
ncbi:hypothetical protein N9Z23_02865, partial [Akkermansiaceae bacterium]|nr:hypothetical protein [Akkermansiaceae bacterium]